MDERQNSSALTVVCFTFLKRLYDVKFRQRNVTLPYLNKNYINVLHSPRDSTRQVYLRCWLTLAGYKQRNVLSECFKLQWNIKLLRYTHLPANKIQDKGHNSTRDVHIINNEVPLRNDTVARAQQALLLFYGSFIRQDALSRILKTVSCNSVIVKTPGEYVV